MSLGIYQKQSSGAGRRSKNEAPAPERRGLAKLQDRRKASYFAAGVVSAGFLAFLDFLAFLAFFSALSIFLSAAGAAGASALAGSSARTPKETRTNAARAATMVRIIWDSLILAPGLPRGQQSGTDRARPVPHFLGRISPVQQRKGPGACASGPRTAESPEGRSSYFFSFFSSAFSFLCFSFFSAFFSAFSAFFSAFSSFFSTLGSSPPPPRAP